MCTTAVLFGIRLLTSASSNAEPLTHSTCDRTARLLGTDSERSLRQLTAHLIRPLGLLARLTRVTVLRVSRLAVARETDDFPSSLHAGPTDGRSWVDAGRVSYSQSDSSIAQIASPRKPEPPTTSARCEAMADGLFEKRLKNTCPPAAELRRARANSLSMTFDHERLAYKRVHQTHTEALYTGRVHHTATVLLSHHTLAPCAPGQSASVPFPSYSRAGYCTGARRISSLSQSGPSMQLTRTASSLLLLLLIASTATLHLAPLLRSAGSVSYLLLTQLDRHLRVACLPGERGMWLSGGGREKRGEETKTSPFSASSASTRTRSSVHCRRSLAFFFPRSVDAHTALACSPTARRRDGSHRPRVAATPPPAPTRRFCLRPSHELAGHGRQQHGSDIVPTADTSPHALAAVLVLIVPFWQPTAAPAVQGFLRRRCCRCRRRCLDLFCSSRATAKERQRGRRDRHR